MRLWTVGDRRRDAAASGPVTAAWRPRSHRPLERPGDRSRRVPSPGGGGGVDAQRAEGLRRRFGGASAPPLSHDFRAGAGGGGVMAEILQIDRIRCDGHGLCAELLPELIRLDDWGYPIIKPGNVPPSVVEYARRAVDACPVLALRLARTGALVAG